MAIEKTVRDIKTIKIQGAENIAIAAVKAIQQLIKKHVSLSKLEKTKDSLINARPTEPCLRNCLNYLFHNVDFKNKKIDKFWIKKEINQNIFYVLKHFKESEKKIAEIGARKIKNSSVVFTHCHSSTVMDILKQAKKQADFEVHNTETRPLYQGRTTAKELLKAGIPVTMYVDSGARLALKQADLMLIGCDAITTEGKVINKIGSEMFAEIAYNHHAPVYVCTNSWKFDPKTVFGYEEPIEKRKGTEVWESAPKGLKIDNHAFEKISPDLITGIISELGIYPPEVFVEEIKDNYNWMF